MIAAARDSVTGLAGLCSKSIALRILPVAIKVKEELSRIQLSAMYGGIVTVEGLHESQATEFGTFCCRSDMGWAIKLN